jgi:hypothetical protein
MKKYNNFLILIWLSLLMLAQSCSKDEVVSTNQKKYGGKVSFTANGQINSFTQNSIYSYSGILELSSLLNTKEQLTITIVSGVAESSYDFKNKGAEIIYFDDAGNFYDKPTGQVVITKIDEKNKTISGTFSAKVERPSPSATVTISNGVFTDVPFVIQEDGIPGSLNIANISGTPFIGRLRTTSPSPSFDFVSSNRVLSFSFPNSIVEGKTYNAIDLVAPRYYIRYVEGLYSFSPKSGTFTITKYMASKEIEGNFVIEMESYPVGGKTRSITDGTFAVKFQ